MRKLRPSRDPRDDLVRRRAASATSAGSTSYKREPIDWQANRKALDALIEEYRGKHDYDCIVPFSGGKDSTWTLYYPGEGIRLKPLVVRFDHGFMRPNLEENVKRTIRRLGVDVLEFTPNWKVVQRLMLQSFLEKGDFCWHCHTGIYLLSDVDRDREEGTADLLG